MKIGIVLPLNTELLKKLLFVPIPLFCAHSFVVKSPCRYIHVTMRFFFTCFFVFLKMEIELSCHTPRTNLIGNKFSRKSHILFVCEFSMQGELKFTPNLRIHRFFRPLNNINQGLNALLTVPL